MGKMKRIKLTNTDQYALVDDDLFEEISRYKWCSNFSPYSGNGYALKTSAPHYSMHRYVLGLTEKGSAKGLYVDHINHNRLDNRRENLRLVTASQNQLNLRKKSEGAKSSEPDNGNTKLD